MGGVMTNRDRLKAEAARRQQETEIAYRAVLERRKHDPSDEMRQELVEARRAMETAEREWARLVAEKMD